MSDDPGSYLSGADLLMDVCRLTRRRLRATMCDCGLHPGQEAVLRILRSHHERISQTSLASQLRISPASITALLQQLESAGLVERQRNERDQREVLVSSTEAGKAATTRSDVAWQAFEQEIQSVLSEGEEQQLRYLLHRLVENPQGHPKHSIR